MRNPFSRQKKKEEDILDILRETLKEGSTEKNDPQTTAITKVETLTVERKEEQQPLEEQSLPTEELVSEEELNLVRKLIDMFKGKIEIGNRLRPLLNPENLQTTTRLSESEVSFVADAHWLANQWKVFEPLRDLANEICETNISAGGKGRQEAINFVSALTEGKLLKSLMFSAEMPGKGKFGLGKKGAKAEGEAET